MFANFNILDPRIAAFCNKPDFHLQCMLLRRLEHPPLAVVSDRLIVPAWESNETNLRGFLRQVFVNARVFSTPRLRPYGFSRCQPLTNGLRRWWWRGNEPLHRSDREHSACNSAASPESRLGDSNEFHHETGMLRNLGFLMSIKWFVLDVFVAETPYICAKKLLLVDDFRRIVWSCVTWSWCSIDDYRCIVPPLSSSIFVFVIRHIEAILNLLVLRFCSVCTA